MRTPEAILERLHRAGYRHVTLETNAFGQIRFVFAVGQRVKLSNWGAFDRKLARIGLTCGGTSIAIGGIMHSMDIRAVEE